MLNVRNLRFQRINKWVLITTIGIVAVFTGSAVITRLPHHEVEATTYTKVIPVVVTKNEVKPVYVYENTNQDIQAIFHHQPTENIGLSQNQVKFKIPKVDIGKQVNITIEGHKIPVVYRGLLKNVYIFTMYQKDKKYLSHQVNTWKLG